MRRSKEELEEEELLERTYRISRENNQMLHSMRRSAFFGGIIKLIVWIALLGFPIWLYVQYVNPLLSDVTSKVNQVQEVGNDIGIQFEGVNSLINDLKNLPIPGFSQEE
jgi:hypothetical protein